MYKVKICGITNLEDALFAQKSGAVALGFIFTEKSPRYISQEIAKNIILKLEPLCERVGVFLNQEITEILEIVHYCGLSTIQLHGNEDSNYIKELKEKTNLPIIKAFRKPKKQEILDFSEDNLNAFLIDGEEEIMLDEIYKKKKLPLIFAGGLSKENIKNYLQKYSFLRMLDLCSSIEEKHGKKDLNKIKAFFDEISIY